MKDEEYNGWRNHATWNVALWISNDEGLYQSAKEAGTYTRFRDLLHDQWDDAVGSVIGPSWTSERIAIETPDGVSWNDSGLDIADLDDLIAEL